MTDPMECAHLLVETQSALAGQGVNFPHPFRLTFRRVDGFEWDAGCNDARHVAELIEAMHFPEVELHADPDYSRAVLEVEAILVHLRSLFRVLH